jgi:hypothetical protein
MAGERSLRNSETKPNNNLSIDREFAQRIHPANRVHALRKHETTVENPLKCHIELQNSSHPKWQGVVGINKVCWDDVRRGISAYSRHPVDTYLKCVKEYTPFLDKVGDVYAMVDDNHELISQE